MTATPKITWGWFWGFQANIVANIVPEVAPGSSGILLQIRPYFSDIDYSNVIVSLFGKDIGFTFFVNIISKIFEWLSNSFLPYIKVPAIPETNARVSEANMFFLNNYIQSGFSLTY